MRQGRRQGFALLIQLGIGAIAVCAASHAHAVDFRILSTTQIIVNTGCPTGCTATIAGPGIAGSKTGKTAPVVTEHLANPNWTLVTFNATDFQFSKSSLYTLSFTSSNPNGPQTIAVPIDTKPTLQFVQGAGSQSVNLRSNIAFALPGSTSALQVGAGPCSNNAPHQFAHVMLEYPGLEISLQKTPFCPIDLTDLNPNAIGVIQGILIHPSSKSSGKKKAQSSTPILGVADVLGDPLTEPDTTPALSRPKVPANRGAAWLWIDGTVTAGTGAVPAWVLDGKLAPWTMLNGTYKWTWTEADADVGNNKIGGQSAKDEIDFIGPYPTYYGDWKVVGTEISLSPTYETNLELDHRNMLAVADILWDFAALNKTVLVRNALKNRNDLTKMPKQGDFSGNNANWGESLRIHTGFEGGGALDSVTVTNSKEAIIGTIPTYSIARIVPQLNGTLQYRWFTVESAITGRYLVTTEHTAVNDKDGNPYLETVTGWKAVNVLTTNWAPGSNPNIKFGVTYTNGFSAPTYQRANGVKIGVAVAY